MPKRTAGEQHRQQEHHRQVWQRRQAGRAARPRVTAAATASGRPEQATSGPRAADRGRDALGSRDAASLGPVTKWMAMPSARRTSSCGSERREQLCKEPAARAADHDLGDVLEPGEAQDLRRQCRCPRASCVSPPSDSASFMASSTRWRARRRCNRPPGRSTVTAIHGASIRSASRLAVRTIGRRSASGPTQARMRSPAGHGPSIACACMRSTRSVSMRSAARRSASSRSAVRFCGLKKLLARAGGRVLDSRPCPRPGA